MQSSSAVSPSSASHHDFTTSGRQVSTGHYNSSSCYGHGDLNPSHSSAIAQHSYHASQYSGYGNSSASHTYSTHGATDRTNGWPSSAPDHALARTPSYAHVGSQSFGLSGMHSQSGHSRSGPYYPKMEDTSYDSQRPLSSTCYGSMPPSPDRYRVSPTSMAPPSYPSGYSSYGLPAGHPSASLHPVPTTSGSEVRCEWGNRSCMVHLEDSSPSGIARHLRQYHDVPVTDNRTRGVCLWGGRCNKDMFPSSFGKHIAECHLRNMTKQCPHCGADFARADTLSRHIKAFCPNTTTHAGHSYSSS